MRIESEPHGYVAGFEKEPTREKEPMKVERQPESGWKLEEDKHFLEIVHVDSSGKEYVTSDTEFTPGKYSTTLNNILLMKEDVKLIVTPYRMQAFGKEVSIQVKNGRVSKLAIGIADEKYVAWIATFWKDAQKYEHVAQYFFKKDGSPGGCNLGFIQSPNWPTNRPRVLTSEMRNHFGELLTLLPKDMDLMTNLFNTTGTLAEPGRDYQKDSGGVSIQL